jgi:L-threonylcarbamoyladenylate synthase
MDDAILEAAVRIRKGQLVGFPTETVYGLGADAFNANAVAKIFKAKGRPSDNPLIVHISDRAMLERVTTYISPEAEKLIHRFWPGPLTILFEKKAALPQIVTGGLSTVGVRMPAHPVALQLIRTAGTPIAAPSANKSGRPSPTRAEHVRDDFPGLHIIDAGRTRHGVESTFVALDGRPRVLRLGAITLEQLREVLPGISVETKAPKHGPPPSPGMKYRHYAPKIPMILFRPTKIVDLKRYAQKSHTVVLCKEKYMKYFKNAVNLGKTDTEVAHNIYAALRTKRMRGTLLVLGIQKRGIGKTVMDRLERAATKII